MVMGGHHSTCAFTILEFRPVLSDKMYSEKRETHFDRPAQAAPIFVRSSYIAQDDDCKQTSEAAPSGADVRRWGASRNSQHTPHANVMAPANVAVTFSDGNDMCRKLNQYMERLVYIYSHAMGEEKDNRLIALNSQFKPFLEQLLPLELRPDLEQYQKLCECIHSLSKSGLNLNDIQARGLCGQMSTKQARIETYGKCRNCEKLASQR